MGVTSTNYTFPTLFKLIQLWKFWRNSKVTWIWMVFNGFCCLNFSLFSINWPNFCLICNRFSFASIVILSVPTMCFIGYVPSCHQKTQTLHEVYLVNRNCVSEGHIRQASSPEIFFFARSDLFPLIHQRIPPFIHQVIQDYWAQHFGVMLFDKQRPKPY